MDHGWVAIINGDHHFRSGKISTPRAWPSLHPGFMSMSTWEIQYSLGLNNEFHIKKGVELTLGNLLTLSSHQSHHQIRNQLCGLMAMIVVEIFKATKATKVKIPVGKDFAGPTHPKPCFPQIHWSQNFESLKWGVWRWVWTWMLTSPDATHKYGKPAAGGGGLSFQTIF